MAKTMKSLVSMDSFDRTPYKTMVNGREVLYLCFSRPKTAHKKPVVILGGAFQNFESFRKDVEILSDVHPILLVDLPGQGSNSDLADDLSFEDLADILCGLIDQMGIEKITPLAFSSGSAIGYYFASKYPERVDKLILGGMTPEVRESVRLILEESFIYLNEGRLEQFSAGVVLNLLNFYRRYEIKGARSLQRSLYKNMLKLGAEDLCRYEINTRRLLDLRSLPEGPVCETLVLVGEYDNFTTPAECFEVAKSCQNSTFAIISNTDHLAPYENKNLVNKLYKKFLAGVPLNGTSGVKIFNRSEYPVTIQRLEPRYEMDDMAFIEESGVSYPVGIINISTAGIMLEKGMTENIPVSKKSLKIRLPFNELELDLFLLDDRGETVRGVFNRCDFAKCKELEEFVRYVASQSNEFRSAA